MKTTLEEKSKLDLAVGKFMFSQNMAFSGVENPQFRKLCSSLRPGYTPPNRKQVAGPILDDVFNEVRANMDMEIKRKSSVLVLSQDGWSNIMNNPIIAHSLNVGDRSYLYSLENCGSNAKTAQYCFDMTKDIIDRIRNDLNKDVTAIVTDNDAKMKAFRSYRTFLHMAELHTI